MSVPEKMLRLTNDLMTLQSEYNKVVQKNLLLRKEIEETSIQMKKLVEEHEKEVEMLRGFVDRAVEFESPSAAIRRKKR